MTAQDDPIRIPETLEEHRLLVADLTIATREYHGLSRLRGAMRDSAIRAAHAAGVSQRELARITGLSQTRIAQITDLSRGNR
jgi:hypothetical protein